MLAPQGRDSGLACEILRSNRIEAIPCASFDQVFELMSEPVGALLVTEEMLTGAEVHRMAQFLDGQPPWSDLPIVAFASGHDRVRKDAVERIASLGNVSFVDRPVQRRTMIIATRAALRARLRQYEARRAIDARDQFLAMLGHELRNPLGAIVLATELIGLRGQPDPRLAKQVGLIERQSRHLGRLVDDLLDVARVTSGKVTINRAEVDLNLLCQRCVQSSELLTQTHGLHMKFTAAPGPTLVLGDVVRLEQVLTNLLTNAIKFTPRNGQIDVTVARQDTEAVVVVSDTGTGIAEEHLRRIFDLFAQTPTTLDRTRGGLGLGLTLVRTLVEMHGGTVSARSEGPGRGSQFEVRLPLHLGAVNTVPVSASALTSSPDRRRILVVEDNSDIREMLEETLIELGHIVESAIDGPQGLHRVLTWGPDVALVDIGLPGFDGYHLAREIRRAARPDVFLVAMTGYGQPEDRKRAFDAGFDEYLVKPVDMQTLARVIERRPSNVSRPRPR